MNVLKTLMAVLRCVPTQMAATLAPVVQAIAWQVIDVDVMVNTYPNKLQSNVKFDPIFHSDINECNENTDACDHLCSNTVGSYTCNCRTGYRLASNGLTCNGIAPVT
jgi:hypothetical protein